VKKEKQTMPYKIHYVKYNEIENPRSDQWFWQDRKDEYFVDRASALARLHEYAIEKSFLQVHDPVALAPYSKFDPDDQRLYAYIKQVS
jgi:hypothetical protein